MATFAMIVLLATGVSPLSGHQDAKPDVAAELLQKEEMNCRDWSIAANHVIGLGRAKAIAWLNAASMRERPEERGRHGNWSFRVGHLCRIVFQPKEGSTLRRPLFGALSLPYLTMPDESWPHYPLVEQDGVWFQLSESYFGTGAPEPPSDYVAYCLANGSLRAEPVQVPTRTVAQAALSRLLKSPKWLAIKWEDSGDGVRYKMGPDSIVSKLRRQAEF